VIVRENVRHREQELARCRDIIANRAQEILARFAGRASEPRTAARAPGFALFQPAACVG